VDAKTGAWHGIKHTAPPVFDEEKKIWRWCGKDCATHDSSDDTCEPDDINFRFCPGRYFTGVDAIRYSGAHGKSIDELGLPKDDMDSIVDLIAMLDNEEDLSTGYLSGP
jgi:hypothetical protein